MWPDPAARVSALIRHNTWLLLREPGPLVSRLLMPLGFIVLMCPLYVTAQGEAAGKVQVVTGALVVFSLLALSIVGNAILTERIWHTWNRIRVTAVRPAELLTGKVVPVLGALVLQQALVLGFGAVGLGMPVPDVELVVLVVVCWSLSLIAFGALLGLVARSLDQMSAAFDIGGILLSGLAGALVPLADTPGWVREIAPLNPGYWAVRAFHSALAGEAGVTTASCAVLLGFAAAAGVLIVYRLRRGGARTVSL